MEQAKGAKDVPIANRNTEFKVETRVKLGIHAARSSKTTRSEQVRGLIS